jgi:hypothetical protein
VLQRQHQEELDRLSAQLRDVGDERRRGGLLSYYTCCFVAAVLFHPQCKQHLSDITSVPYTGNERHCVIAANLLCERCLQVCVSQLIG